MPEQLFRAIVDRTHLPFVVSDREGAIRYVSESIAEFSSWRPADLVGRNVFDLVADGQADAALEGLAEILTNEHTDAGIPVVFAARDRDDTTMWVEVGAMRIADLDGPDLVAFRVRPWEAERHRALFLGALLADAPLAEVLEPLTRSITETVEGLGAAVHHGFDGAGFASVVGSWPGAAELPRRDGPWIEAVRSGELVVGEGAAPAGAPGPVPTWMIPVHGGPLLAPAVLSVWLPNPGPPLLGHRNLLTEAAGYVELALVRHAEHDRLLHLARRDSLTGVWNRATFHDLVAEALEGERHVAVAFCDLDGFKEINDEHGHVAGDDVLVHVAARLRNALRSGDELARMGGDEFTVLCRDIPDQATAEQVGQRLLAALDEPFTVPGGVASVGLSVGLALATPGVGVDELLQAADAALYRSKKAGGGRFAVAS